MLNFIYYPVSAILWFWHEVFGFLLGPDNGFAWMLSVIFLVATLRGLLIKPFVSQMRSMRKMQEFQPQIKKLQEKYKGDRTKLAEEMQKLQKEHGVNPVGGCLPLLVQLPVFIGLFHVLRGFQPNFPYNYVFGRSGVVSFNNAEIAGIKLSDSISGSAQALGHFSLNFDTFRPEVIPVALPLMIVAAVATHFTARISQAHQSAASASNPQAAILGKVTMWVFPVGLLVFGAFFPIAILVYFLSQNVWTLGQQFFVYRKIDREEEAARAQAREQRDLLAPKPGQKPTRAVRAGTNGVADEAEPEPVDVPAAVTVVDGEPADAPAPGARRHPGKVTTGKNGPKGGGPNRGSGRPSPGKAGGTSPKNGNGGGTKNAAGRNGVAASTVGAPSDAAAGGAGKVSTVKSEAGSAGSDGGAAAAGGSPAAKVRTPSPKPGGASRGGKRSKKRR